jgi:hypothetical protein
MPIFAAAAAITAIVATFPRSVNPFCKNKDYYFFLSDPSFLRIFFARPRARARVPSRASANFGICNKNRAPKKRFIPRFFGAFL